MNEATEVLMQYYAEIAKRDILSWYTFELDRRIQQQVGFLSLDVLMQTSDKKERKELFKISPVS